MAVTAIHPGEHMAAELDVLLRSAAELARKLGVPTNRLTQILNGTRSITGDTSLRLGHFFGTSAQFWLNLQVSMTCGGRRKRRESPSSGFQGSNGASLCMREAQRALR